MEIPGLHNFVLVRHGFIHSFIISRIFVELNQISTFYIAAIQSKRCIYQMTEFNFYSAFGAHKLKYPPPPPKSKL
jgi:hypothetical protein